MGSGISTKCMGLSVKGSALGNVNNKSKENVWGICMGRRRLLCGSRLCKPNVFATPLFSLPTPSRPAGGQPVSLFRGVASKQYRCLVWDFRTDRGAYPHSLASTDPPHLGPRNFLRPDCVPAPNSSGAKEGRFCTFRLLLVSERNNALALSGSTGRLPRT